jgi:hypothetical protein
MKITKTSIRDYHVHAVLKETCSGAANRTSINPDLASDANPSFDKVEHLLNIVLKSFRTWLSFGSAVSSVIPNHYVYLLVQEVLEVESVRVVYHVLVCHCVRIAQDECVQAAVARLTTFKCALWRIYVPPLYRMEIRLIMGIPNQIIINQKNVLFRRCKKHGVNFNTIFVLV